MIILEKPYSSPELLRYLEESQTPVLDNPVARGCAVTNTSLALLPEKEFAEQVNAGARLYSTSENALDWVARHVKRRSLLQTIEYMKDKAKLRTALASLYPGYYFREAEANDLPHIAPESLPLPLVLKPVVGFFSVGVYVIGSVADWRAALADIQAQRERWRRDYPDSVVGGERFILEQYIDGDEYAVDAYYDADGQAVIVDILKHDFSSASDVSDRLYYTSPEIIREKLAPFTEYLNTVGRILDIRDFPLHLEIREGAGGIIPIEFNPLRFAGWCSTDVALFAYGVRTYQYYLENLKPDWDSILAGKEGNLFSMVILDKPAGTGAEAKLDFARIEANFTEVVHLRKLDFPGSPLFAFVFARTPANRREELDRIVSADLRTYLA